MSTPIDFDELLDQATPRERTVWLCLKGDLVGRAEEVAAELARRQAQNIATTSLAGDGTGDLTRELEALTEAMEPFRVPFLVRGLSRPAYRALVAAHPPRMVGEGTIHPDDKEEDINTATFWEALIRACVVSPELTDTRWQKLAHGVPATETEKAKPPVLTDGQISELYSAAIVVCRGTVDVPFFSAVSRLIASSGNGSRSLNGSAIASSGSTDGDPDTSSLATP